MYNLAAQSHVMVSFETPSYTAQCDAIGTLNVLEAIRKSGAEHVRFVQVGGRLGGWVGGRRGQCSAWGKASACVRLRAPYALACVCVVQGCGEGRACLVGPLLPLPLALSCLLALSQIERRCRSSCRHRC